MVNITITMNLIFTIISMTITITITITTTTTVTVTIRYIRYGMLLLIMTFELTLTEVLKKIICICDC